MTAISLSSNAEIQSWELNHQNADLTVNGVTLVGNEAAAYLFGLALSGIDLSAFGSLGQERFYRTDAVLEFPPGSGQRVSLTEISDALRYKYSIDPLVEFSSSLGLAGYNLADVNSILTALNNEFKGRFELALLNRTEDSAQTVYISQPTVAASLPDLLTAEGRKALVDLAKTLRAKVLSNTDLQQKLNPLLGIGLNETVFPGATQNSTTSLNQLLEPLNQAIGGNLQALMPDLFADGKLHLNDLNVLLAAAREAVPAESANLAALSLDLFRVTQGSQVVTGNQALAMLTAKTMATLATSQKQGASLDAAPTFKLDDRVFSNPLVSPAQAISLGELVHALRQNAGYDPLSHLDPVPTAWRIHDIAAYIDGVNDALTLTTPLSIPSFTNTSTNSSTVVTVSYADPVLAKLKADMADPGQPAYMDDLAELRRQIGTLSTYSATGLNIGSSTLTIVGSLQVATALQAGVLANSGILARLSFDAPIGLDEPLWQDNQGQVQTLRELLANANILNQVLTALPRLSANGLDFDGFNKLQVTARQLNPEADRQLEWVHPWFQPYVSGNQSFEGGNALLLRMADSLFAQVGSRTYQNQPLGSTERVFADPTDTLGQRKLSIDDISQLLSRLLGVDPLPRRDTWYAQDIEQAVKDLYAGVKPAIAAPGRASSAAITAADLVSFVNALVPASGATFGPDTFDASTALFSHTVNGVTRSRSLNGLLQIFSTQSNKDLAPRLQALGILRDGHTVQLRGLNALRTWVDTAQPGQVTSTALPVTGTPTAVDTSVDYASVLAANQDDDWGLGALQRLMAEWALVPDADRTREWARWQMRFQALLADLDDSVGGLSGLGLDTGTQAALRSLTTSATAPELFPQGAAIQTWLTTLQSRMTAALATVNQDLRNLSLATNNPGYASVRNDLAQRVAILEQQALDLQQGSGIVSRLKAAGNTLGAFQSALAAEKTGQRPDVLAWLARFDIPASDLNNASFRTSTGGLDAFNLNAWIAQAPAAPYTTDQTEATLTAAEADWQSTAATWNTWLGDLLTTRIPALRTSLTADLQLHQAYKAVAPTDSSWDEAITRIQGQLTRSQALMEAIPALRTAVMASPDALRTALQSAQTRLGVTDILAELARHDVPASDLSNRTNILPQVRYFDTDAFWAAGRPGAAGSSNSYPAQQASVATQANTTWITATTPVIDWLETAQTRMQGVQAQVDSAITRLTARWEEPNTTAQERTDLASAIDSYRQFRNQQQTRLAAAERLLAAQNDAVALNTALSELQTAMGGQVLSVLAIHHLDPASLSGTGPHVRSVADVSCPDLTAATAAVTPAYANDSVLSNAFTAWNSAMPNWRSWINTLASRTSATVSELGISLATLQLQRTQVGNTAAENEIIEQAIWRVQTRLSQFTAVKNSVTRLQSLVNQPAAFNAAVPQEVQALARYADDLPVGQRGITDLFSFLSYFDADLMARDAAQTTVAVSIERFDYASWLSTYPQGSTPRSITNLAPAFDNWDSRTSYRTWLSEVTNNVTALSGALQADRTRLYQALSADGNDDTAVQTLMNTVIADQQRLFTVTAALDRLRNAPDTATGFAAAVTAAKTAAGLSDSTDLFDWLSDYNVPAASLTQAGLRQGTAAIASFDLAAWQQTRSGAAAFTDSTIGTSNPASWAQAVASIQTRAAVVEQALTQAQIRKGWSTTNAANTALAAAMAATPAIASNSARASSLALAVAATDRLQQATTDVLRSPMVDAEGKLRSRSLEQGDDGRFYHDSQAVLLRVGRMLASLPGELTAVSPSQAAFTDPMWGNRRLSLTEVMNWCREASGIDLMTLADPANQRASWTRAELNFLIDGINQQLRTDATQPVLSWQGTAASVLVSSATLGAGQQAAQISQAQFQNLLRAQILGSDLSQTVVETEMRDELVGVINLLGQLDGSDFALAATTGGNSAAIDTLIQELGSYGNVLTDPARRSQALTGLQEIVAVLDAPQGLSVVRNQLDSLQTRATTLLGKATAASPAASAADLALVNLAINSINTLGRAAALGASALQSAVASLKVSLNVSLRAAPINANLDVTDVFTWLQKFDAPTDTSWSSWTTSPPTWTGANTSLGTEAAVNAMATNTSPTNGLEATRLLLSRVLTAQNNSLGVSDWLQVITRKLAGGAISNNQVNGIDPLRTYLQDLKTSALNLQTYYSQREAVYARMASPSLTSAIPSELSGISNPALATSVTSLSNSLLNTYNTAGALPNLSTTLTTAASGITPAVSTTNIRAWAEDVFGTDSALNAALDRSEVQAWLSQLTTSAQGLETFYTARKAEANARVQTYAAAAGAYDLTPSSTQNAGRLTGLNTLVTALNTYINETSWTSNPNRDLAAWLDSNVSLGAITNTTRDQLREWCLATFGAASALAAAVPASGGNAVAQSAWSSALAEITQLRDRLQLTQDAMDPLHVSTLTDLLNHANFTNWVEHANLYTTINTVGGGNFNASDVRKWASTLFGASSALVSVIDNGNPPVTTPATPPTDVSYNHWLTATRQLKELQVWMQSRGQLDDAWTAAKASRDSAQTALAGVQTGLAALQQLNTAAATSADALASQWATLRTAHGNNLQGWLRRFDVPAATLTAQSGTQLSVTYNNYGTGVVATPATTSITLNLSADALGQSRTSTLAGSPPGLSAYEVLQQALIAAETSAPQNSATYRFDFFDNADWTSWQTNKTGAATGFTDTVVSTRLTGGPSASTDWVRALQELQQLPTFVKMAAQSGTAQNFAAAAGSASQQSARVSDGLAAINALITAAQSGVSALTAKVTELKGTYATQIGAGGDLFTWLRSFDVPADQLTSPIPSAVTLSTRVFTGDTDVVGSLRTETRNFSSSGAVLGDLPTNTGLTGSLAGLSERELGLAALIDTLANDTADFFDGAEWTSWRANPTGARTGYTEAQVSALSAANFTTTTASAIRAEANTIAGKIQNLEALQSGNTSANLVAATQTLNALGMPLSDPTRRAELLRSLNDLKLLLDNNTVDTSLSQVQRNLSLQQQLAVMNTQWGVTDVLSSLTSGRLTSANLGGLAEVRAYLTETKTTAENLRTFYDARFNEASARKSAYEKVSPAYSFRASDATRNANVLANLERGLATMQTTYEASNAANSWPTYYMVAIFHNGSLHGTGNANTVHWDAVSSWANKLGIDTSNYLTKDLATANNAPITQAQWKATMVALQQVIGSMRTSMGQYSGEKFDRLESIYAGLRDQGFVANFSQQVNSFGYSLSPSDPTATTSTANLRPTSQRIDAAELTTLAVGLFGTDSRIKVAIDAAGNCTQAQWQAALQEFNDLFDLLKTRNQLQAAWETEQALEHAAYHSREEITAGLSAMTSLITATNTSASDFQSALTSVGTAQQAWNKGQDVMTWLRSYDVDPSLLTYGSQSSLATSYQQYGNNSALDPTMSTWTSASVNWGNASMGLGVPSTLPTGASAALDTANLAIKAAVEAELRGDYHFFDWTRWKLGSVDETDLAGMNRADTARLYTTLESTRISAERLEDHYTDRLNEAQDRVTAFQNMVPGYDFSDPAANTGHLALLDALVSDMTTVSTTVPYTSNEFKYYVFSRVYYAQGAVVWGPNPQPTQTHAINTGMFIDWSDKLFGADSQLSQMLRISWINPSKVQWDAALEQIEQLRGTLRAAVQANAVAPAAPNPFTAQADGIANLITDLEANNAPVSFGSLFGAAGGAARYGMTATELSNLALRTIGESFVSRYAAADADLIRSGAYNDTAIMVIQLRLIETELRAVTPQLASLQTTLFTLDDRLRSWTSPQNLATTVTSSQGNSQLLHMAIGLYGSNSKIKVAWNAGSAVTPSQWNDAVLEAKALMDHLRALAQLSTARTRAQEDVDTTQTILTEVSAARTAIGTLSTAAYAVTNATAGTAAETNALTALQTAFNAVTTPSGQDVMDWLRNFQVNASSLTYTDPNRLTTRWTNKSGNALTSTARRENTSTTWVSWDDLLMGIPRSASLDATSQQPAYRLAQIAAIEAQVANRFTSFDWAAWKASVAANTPTAGTALQGASTGYTNTTVLAAADRDLSANGWSSLGTALGTAIDAVEKLQAPDVLVVPNGVTDITLRNLDEPAELAAYGGLVADVPRRDAVQSAVSSLVDSLQANADLSTDQQISRLSAQLEELQDSLEVDDLLVELTQGVYSTDNLTGSLTGITEYLNTLITNATGLQTFMTQRQTEAQTRVDAYVRAAGAYDTSMTVTSGVVVPSNDAIGQALSQLYTALKTQVANVASSGINLAEAIKTEAVYAAGQYGNEARKRDVPITPEMLRDWCVAKYGSSSSFKQLLDLGTTSTNATLAQAALNEVKGVLLDGAFRNPALASDPNTLRANQLDALATAMGSSGNLRTVLVPSTEIPDAATLSTWATNLFGPNSKIKAAFDANAPVSGTNWTDAVEEVRQLARDIRVTQLASNTAFIDQLQATYNGLSALYSAQDWISYVISPEDQDVAVNRSYQPNQYRDYEMRWSTGKNVYGFTENKRNFATDWANQNNGNPAINSSTVSTLSQWLAVPSSAGLIKTALEGGTVHSGTYGNALKELNELIVQIKQRSNLMPAVLSARQSLADAQLPQAEVNQAVTTLTTLKVAAATGSNALLSAVNTAISATSASRGSADLFGWLRNFDVHPSQLWTKPIHTSLAWEENVYALNNYTVPITTAYSGTWPNLVGYTRTQYNYGNWLAGYASDRGIPEATATARFFTGWPTYYVHSLWAYNYLWPTNYSYTETIPLNPIGRSGTWTPDWTGTGFDPNSTPGSTWGLVSASGQQTIGVTPYRTRLASLFKAEATGQFDSFSWRQWKAGGGQTSTGAYVAAYDQANTARTDQSVLNSSGLAPTDLLTIQGQLSGLLALLSQCRSLSDVIKAAQTDSGINLMGLLQQLGIVVDGQYASRDGLNKLLEVLRHEMPERISADTVDALASATESTRSRTLAEFQAAVSVTQQRENALQKLQDHLDSWNNYTTLYERRTHWTQWLAELQTLASSSRAQVGELGLNMDALIATLQADTTYTQAAANTLDSYVPHLTFFTQVRWRTEQLLDHWYDLWDTLEVKRKEYVAYANNSGNGATNNSAANIATAKEQIAAIDVLQAKIEANRQATVQANEAVNRFLAIVPPNATPAAITGEKLELLQQAVADFKQQIGGQDVMAYLHDYSVPVSAWQGHNNTTTKDNYTFTSLGGSAADNVVNGPVRYVASLSPSVFSFERWLNTSNPQGAAATSLSVSDTITDQYAYVTGLLTNASKTDTSLLNLGKIPSDETWTEVTQKLGTARTVARNALLQAQAQLKLDYADIGAALSGLRKVQVPGGYDGYWYQMALALQSLQSTDLPANGVTATAAVLEYPPGSGERVSLKTLLDNLQTQSATDPQRTALAQKLLDVLQDDPTAQLGTNATLLTQAKLLDTGLLSRFENTTNFSNFAGALVTAFGAGSNAISNNQFSAWGVSLFGADSQLAAAIGRGNTTLTSTQWTAAARELRLIQEDLERGYAGALNGQTAAVREMAAHAMMLSEALTTLDAATIFSGYAASLTTLCGGSRPFALSTTTINQWATQLFGSGSALSAALAGTGTLTSAQWKAANAELSLIQKDIAKGEGGVLYGNKQAKLAALVNEASQGGDPLAVLTNGVFSLRDLQVDGSKTIKNTLADADNLSRLVGFLQGTLLGDAQRLSVAQQVQAVLTPDAATDGLDAALTLKLQSALASLRSTYNTHDWSTTSTKDMWASLNSLLTTDELTRLRADAVGLRAESRAVNQYVSNYNSRLERMPNLAYNAGKVDWMLALSELDWLLTARTFRSADQMLGKLDKPAGVDDWLLAVTQGQVSDADLSVDAFAKGADSSDILVKLYQLSKIEYDSMSTTATWDFAGTAYTYNNYGLDMDLHWSPARGSGYTISYDEIYALATRYAGPDSKLAYAVSSTTNNQPIKGFGENGWGPALTKTQLAEVLKELEGIIVGGLRQQQVNASLTQALEDVVSNTPIPDAPVSLASVFAGVVDMNTLDWAKRQTLLSAIRQALPSVNAALQSWAEPEPDNAGQRMALTVAQRIQAWKAAYEETARRTFLATATSLELRDSLTEGADIYVDRHGTYYIDGMRTRAMDVAVMTRAVAHTSFAAEYKELMDAMSERNALIAAANSYVNNVDNVTATANATSSTPLAYAAYQVWQLLDSSTFTGAADDNARKSLLKAKLLEVQPASGSTDLLYDITSGRVTLSTFDASLYVTSTANTVANGVQFSLVKLAISEFIKFENLLEPLRKQSNNVTSGDILSDMTGGSYSLKGSNVPLNKSAERIWTFLHTQPSGGGGSTSNFTTVLAEESARNGGIDILSAVTGGDYTSSNWNSNWGTGQMANIKGKVADFIGKTPGRKPYFEDEIDKLTNLLNTLISNKVRDNDLDQGKLQSITSQIQINTEAMTALIKAFNELNSALAQALK